MSPGVSEVYSLLLCDSFQSDILFTAVSYSPLPPSWKAAPYPTSCQATVRAPFVCPLPSCVVLSLPLSVTSWAQLFWLCSYLSTVFQTHHVMSCEEPKLKALATL